MLKVVFVGKLLWYVGIFVQLANHHYYRYIGVYLATVYKVFGIATIPKYSTMIHTLSYPN